MLKIKLSEARERRDHEAIFKIPNFQLITEGCPRLLLLLHLPGESVPILCLLKCFRQNCLDNTCVRCLYERQPKSVYLTFKQQIKYHMFMATHRGLFGVCLLLQVCFSSPNCTVNIDILSFSPSRITPASLIIHISSMEQTEENHTT